MRLRRNQLCPIHRSQFWCGREAIPRERRQRQLGVRRIDDHHHPRGYREIRSNVEMRKLLDKKIVTQNCECAICNEKFTDYSDIVQDHINPAAWEEHGETIIRTTFRLSTGGATERRDRAEADLGHRAYEFRGSVPAG
jgi:hypothetical protein